jgi:hypothetical protein
MSIKRFKEWVVVKDGIQTVPGMPYFYISKEEIMSLDFTNLQRFLKLQWVKKNALKRAYSYAYEYFHAMTFYTKKSHPETYKAMSECYELIKWGISVSGNHIFEVPEGFYITIFRDKKRPNRWTWAYKEFYCPRSYANLETAKKKAFASYYWLYQHIKASHEHL